MRCDALFVIVKKIDVSLYVSVLLLTMNCVKTLCQNSLRRGSMQL